MEGYLKDAHETLQRVRVWTQHTCKCQSKAGMALRCLCWDSNHVFIRLNRSQCEFLTLQLITIFSSLRCTPSVAANAAQELRRISRMAELLVEECRCTQWLLKALEITVGAEYFLEILRDSADVLCEAWSGNPSNTDQILLNQLWGPELEDMVTRYNQLDRDELGRQLEELSVEPSNGDITTHGDLARFLKRKFFDSQPSETLSWHPPELSKFCANINTLDIQVCGNGSSARVANLKLLGKAYALKMPASIFNLESSAFRKEAELLETYRNPHLVRLIGYWNVKRMPFIVEERMDLDLQKLIDKVNHACLQLSPLEVIELLLPVAKVMRYLHDEEVAHRDLKPGNIMCSLQQNFSVLCSPLQDITIKLIDLGDAAVENVISFSGWRTVGTQEYMAPELFQKDACAALDLLKADVFSFGVLLLKVLTGLTVKETGDFGLLSREDYKHELKAGERPIISAPIPECLRSIIESCWAHGPEERPSFDVICKKLLISKFELSRDVYSRRKSFKTHWLDMVRNAEMHMCLHSMPHLVSSLSRALLAPLVFVVFLYCIWTYLHTTIPKQHWACSLLSKCMDFNNSSCASALDSLIAS